VEWVETTAKTVEAAKETALDQLGVAEDDAEFEILSEPRAGLFGFMRGEARVRARIRPTQPRPKVDRRDRRRRRGAGGPGDGTGGGGGGGGREPRPIDETSGNGRDQTPSRAARTGDRRRSRRRGSGGAREGAGETRRNEAPGTAGPEQEDSEVASDLSPSDQADIVAEFLGGLMDGFGLEGSLHQEAVDEETIEVRVDGDDLGILIGPRGQTLQAVQELARAAVQRRLAGGREARIRVDVAGYRQRRREALARFAQGVAEDVRASGVAKALEPMSPPDRKVVHDTVNELAGVATMSEGEEPNRRVVIVPAEPALDDEAVGVGADAGASGAADVADEVADAG
jgi:spoIIIJ-associated protein